MPAASESVLTAGHFLSNLTDMRDGVAQRFTTPSVNIGGVGYRASRALVLDVFIPAYTNRSPGSGVGAYTRPFLTIGLQDAQGDPTTEANWRDLGWLKLIRPHVPAQSTGAGGTSLSSAIFSNRYRFGFQTDRSQVRLTGQYLGSFPDFSQFFAAIVPAILRGTEMD